MGDDQSTLSVWQMPEGAYLPDLTRDQWPTVFLQAAGTADAMTIEWCTRDDAGSERLYTLGHGGVRTGQPDVRIDFNSGSAYTMVYPDEVFAADEAAEIFVHYLHTLTVPDQYALREFDLTQPAS